MTIWAIIPVKPLRRGKSRLSGVLGLEARTALNHYLLSNTLDILSTIPEIEHSLVVSRDPEALTIAREYGARTVQEQGSPQLNIALTRATMVALSHSVQGVLIIPADLPLLTSEDILDVIQRAVNPPVVVITPDRHQQGTNALLVAPPGFIQYEFGPGSFNKHCLSAKKAGARLEICQRKSVALDIDLPEDLELAGYELIDTNHWTE
ncbi:MAG: 2-phospho-L-lactate guanylyltransferase [Anaerolineales bacterium]